MRNWLINIVRFFKTGSFSKDDFKFGDTLFFKNNVSAFEYFCKYGNSQLLIGLGLPALVLEKKEDKGEMRYLLKIASSKGGFVSASSVINQCDTIDVGELVYWMPIRIDEDLLRDIQESNNTRDNAIDERLAYVGFITAILNPAISTSQGWSIKQKLQNDAAP